VKSAHCWVYGYQSAAGRPLSSLLKFDSSAGSHPHTWNFGFRFSVVRFCVLGLDFWFSDFGFLVSGSVFRFSVFRFGVLGFGFQFSGFTSRFPDSGFLVEGFDFRVSVFRFRISSFGS